MVFRLILPDWAKDGTKPVAIEGEFTQEEIRAYNEDGYNVYFLPNYPKVYDSTTPVTGSHIDSFNFVYADMDLKDGDYADKQSFLERLQRADCPTPTYVNDSGNGIHAYWCVTDLDPMSFLRLQRRICRHLKTDEAVSKLYQLMRVPGTVNTKYQDGFKLCEELHNTDSVYTCEDLDKALPAISQVDEAYCKAHYDKTYGLDAPIEVSDKIPLKFMQLLRGSEEVKQIWAGGVDDRSKADFRLGHLMFSHGLSKDEAMSTLVNTAKALARAPAHRVSYAQNIVEKIWTYEIEQDKEALNLSSSVKDILNRSGTTLKGTRFRCYPWLDATATGFRLGHVVGLVAGSGVGKTAFALNMFMGFVANNPDYDHFFVPLEQTPNEIADRWRTMCGENTQLHDKVHVMSNYDEDGSFRHLSLGDIKEYILKFQKVTGRKVGSVVVDHIGALKKKSQDGENQGIIDICHEMKAFAISTGTLLVMQSQAPREKAGIGDLELNKDAAYGTVFFESYVDFLISIWQPLKRCYDQEGCPTVTAFKFCKIRHKKKHLDTIQEDIRYTMLFDPETEQMQEMTQQEQGAEFSYWLNKANNIRKQALSRNELVPYKSTGWTKEVERGGDTSNSSDTRTA